MYADLSPEMKKTYNTDTSQNQDRTGLEPTEESQPPTLYLNKPPTNKKRKMNPKTKEKWEADRQRERITTPKAEPHKFLFPKG